MRLASCALVSALAVAGCGDDGHDHDHDQDPDAAGGTANALFVARNGSLVSFDLATGDERPGTVTSVTGPVDLQPLEDGHLYVNLTGANQILVVDGATMLETARLSSSAGTGLRPVHDFLSPEWGGKQYMLSFNDGDGSAASNSARIVDVAAPSATRFQALGEFPLGIGHHKGAFSKTQPRVVVSNIGDCDNVMSVYDLTDPASVGEPLATLSAVEAGWDGVIRVCDPTYQNGFPPAPHGCATSPLSGKVYCSLTSTGDMVVVDIDAATPTFTLLATTGDGGGYTSMHPDGRHAYTLQESPREGDGGETCGIGQVVVTDTMTDTVVAQVPLEYTGPDCSTALAGTDEESANPGHTYFSHDGNTAFLALGGGYGDANARVRQTLVLDTSDPAAPVQQASIAVGVGTGHGTGTIDGSGHFLYVLNKVDGTVSEIDVATRAVTRTLEVGAEPATIATWGSAEGPSHQTGPVH